jgi:hypothetical protein
MENQTSKESIRCYDGESNQPRISSKANTWHLYAFFLAKIAQLANKDNSVLFIMGKYWFDFVK